MDDLRAEAKERGYKRSEFKTARKTLGVKTYHQHDEDGDNYFWYLED